MINHLCVIGESVYFEIACVVSLCMRVYCDISILGFWKTFTHYPLRVTTTGFEKTHAIQRNCHGSSNRTSMSFFDF